MNQNVFFFLNDRPMLALALFLFAAFVSQESQWPTETEDSRVRHFESSKHSRVQKFDHSKPPVRDFCFREVDREGVGGTLIDS